MDPCKSEGAAVLLVEGPDDCHLVMALCQRRAVPETFVLHECGGWEPALARLNASILSPQEPERLGVIIDANSAGVAARWQSVKDRLSDHGYSFPDALPAEGAVVTAEDLPSVAVWIMPDNLGQGSLEDFCAHMAAPAAVEVAVGAVQQAQEANATRFREAHRAKAVIRTYLAWQDPPGLRLGQAVTQHVLTTEGELSDRFVAWLMRAFP